MFTGGEAGSYVRSRQNLPHSADRQTTIYEWGEALHIEDLERVNWEGFQLLPLHDVFSQNEIICVNNKSLQIEIILRGLDPSNDPVVSLNTSD